MFVSELFKMLGIGILLFAFISNSNARSQGARQVMVLSTGDLPEVDIPTATQKPIKNSKLENLRVALNIRKPNSIPRDTALLNDPDLGSELAETISYIDAVEKEHMKFLDTIDEASLISNLRAQTDNGVTDLTNRTVTSAHLAASDMLLKNQRDRNRKSNAQSHRALVEASKLSRDYMRSSGMDMNDRIQNARHEAFASRVRANADVRDSTLDLRGKRYENRVRQRTRLRNALQAARADLRASIRKSNSALNAAEREDEIRRKIERLQQAQKARETYAAILSDSEIEDIQDLF